ncbi:MAG: hypothetical protein ACI4RR_06120, partial [Eubacterium sp.]
MNRFANYFSEYTDKNILALIGNGEITEFTVSRQQRTLDVGLFLDSFVDYSVIKSAGNSIAEKMQLNKAHINPRFPKSAFDINNIEKILEYVKSDTPAANGFFEGAEAEIEDTTLTVFLKKGGREVLESKQVDIQISKMLYSLFGVDLDVSLMEVQAFDIEKAVREAVEEKRHEEEIKREQQLKNVVHEVWDELPLYKDTIKKIYGKAINEKPKAIKDVSADDGYITVWGDVIKSEVRETKRGTSKIFDFDITDYTSSMTVKMFDDKNLIDSIVNALSDNKTLVISGGYQFDTFSNQYVLRPRAICGILKTEKTDDEEEKRVELHCHTNMSAMDA